MNIIGRVKNRVATYYLDSQVKMKTPFEDALLKLFGKDELNLRLISTPISRFLHAHHAAELQPLGYGEFQKISELVLSILAMGLYHCATVLYPDKMQAIQAQQKIEPISYDTFIAQALQLLFAIVREELLIIDETVHSGVVPEQEMFSPLATRVLQLVFSTNAGFLDTMIVKPALGGILSKELLKLYKSSFWKPIQKEAGEAIKLDDFAELIASCLSSLCDGFSNNILRSHAITPGLQELLLALSSKVIQPLHSLVGKLFPLASEIPLNSLQKLFVAIIAKGISNIVIADGIRHALTLQETMEVVVRFLRNRWFDQLLIINAKREEGSVIKRKDFDPCAKELIEAFLSYDPEVARLILRRFPDLVTYFSSHLQDVEEALNRNQDRESVKERLRPILGELVKDQLQGNPSVLSKDLSTYLGVEDVITQLENVCLHIGEAVLHHAEKFFGKHHSYSILARLISPLVGVEEAELKPCLKGLIPCFLGVDVQCETFKNFFRTQISGIIFAVTTNALEKGAEKGDVADALYYAIQGLLAAFRNEEEGRPSAILDFLFCTQNAQQGLEDYLPLPKGISGKLSAAVCTTFLPKMLDVLHRDSHLWIDSKEELKMALDNDRMAELSHVLGRFVEQFLPYFLREKSTSVSEALLSVTSTYLVQPPGLVTKDNLESEEGDLKPHDIWQQWLSHALEGLGRHSNRNNRMLFRFIYRYTEGFLLVLFGKFKECLERSDREHVFATKILLEEGEEHFGTINRIKNSLRETRASKVAPDILIHHLSLDGKLHPVMDLSNPFLAVQFYKELSGDLLRVMDLDDRMGLPAPAFLKPIVWELFEDLLLPRIVEALVDQIKSPDAIHHYLHSLLNAISSSIKDSGERGEPVGNDHYEDELQGLIEALSGALLQELLGLQPTIAMPLLRFRRVQARLGVSVGQSIRGALEKFTTLELVDLLIRASLPALHNGRWVSRSSKEKFKKKKGLSLPDSVKEAERFFPIKLNDEGVEVKGWDFGFPKTRHAKLRALEKTEEARQHLTQTVGVELEELIHQQADLSIHDALEGIWTEIQTALNEAIHTVFGKEGKKLKKQLDRLCGTIWRSVLYPLLMAITFPARKLGSALLKVYYAHQARARVEDVGHPIHQNFFLHSLERVIHDLAENSTP